MKKNKVIYHTALKPELEISEKLDFFQNDGNVVLKHDITTGPHKYLFKCDVIYSEPAWLAGYQLFLNRAGAKHSQYYEFIQIMSEMPDILKIPYFLIIGKHVFNKFNNYDLIKNITLNGSKAFLIGYNLYGIKIQIKDNMTNYEFIQLLSQYYNCVGDFCCGYGNSGRIFKGNRKHFILSDINGKCIYYVAKELMDYAR